jgi:hypothetical protein
MISAYFSYITISNSTFQHSLSKQASSYIVLDGREVIFENLMFNNNSVVNVSNFDTTVIGGFAKVNLHVLLLHELLDLHNHQLQLYWHGSQVRQFSFRGYVGDQLQ